MLIGELSLKSNLDTQTIRYYEKEGLISKPKRTDSNYRFYENNTIERLTFIKRAKEIGFSLNDIKILLGMTDGKLVRCEEIKGFAEKRLSKIRSQIRDLKAIEKVLSNLVKQCDKSNKITECPILESLIEKR